MPAISRTRRTFTVSFPSDLASQVGRLAKQESRTTSESFREAFRAYRAQQLRKTLDELNTLGRTDKHKGYTPEDVESLVQEVGAEKKKKKTGNRRLG